MSSVQTDSDTTKKLLKVTVNKHNTVTLVRDQVLVLGGVWRSLWSPAITLKSFHKGTKNPSPFQEATDLFWNIDKLNLRGATLNTSPLNLKHLITLNVKFTNCRIENCYRFCFFLFLLFVCFCLGFFSFFFSSLRNIWNVGWFVLHLLWMIDLISFAANIGCTMTVKELSQYIHLCVIRFTWFSCFLLF